MITDLYTALSEELLRWTVSRCGDPALAEELVQEAFVRALKNQDLLSGMKPEQQRAWMYRTVKNLHVDYFRRASYQAAVENQAETQTPDDCANIDLLLVLEMLPDEEKMLFVMRYLQGYSSEDLGRWFGKPAGTIRAKLSSARKHMRQILSEQGRNVPERKE